MVNKSNPRSDNRRKARPIADFGLFRTTEGRVFRNDYNPVALLERFSGPAEDWYMRYLVAEEERRYVGFTFLYAVSTSRCAMAVFSAFLEEYGHRFIDIRLWELVVDCWLAQGGRADALRFLSFHNIVNECVVASFKQAFFMYAEEPGQTEIAIMTEAPAWQENPFLRSAQHVAEALGGTSVKACRAYLSWKNQDSQLGDERYDLIVEFSRDGEYNENNAITPKNSHVEEIVYWTK
ncbi:hypothetical protein M406DRAFT_67962 [Cryphonectria parasitica EP155]|uniref:Uncharacterized protein n=1 Tax=Cryphonectria parasitica (strain ATCC 38755 / EP155) TaxID=660469 RepID=A0A9P5CNW1_CRYP1|nr:uncharacterized protein M406DRAFT_67962 [Cryphonectria parasitica EP155]KAF3765528.1 hypothetical protein M406DRAFT_67962 [Cryphonectria parasitica EP155]